MSMTMSPTLCTSLEGTLTPFLYPIIFRSTVPYTRSPAFRSFPRLLRRSNTSSPLTSTVPGGNPPPSATPLAPEQSSFDPSEDYTRPLFSDNCIVQLHAGAGGHGCISFLREKYIAAGPPNGGDGGSGGSIYIQAVHGETSLHKLARRRLLKAARGKNGRGKGQGGERGEDLLVQVPVGTVVREISRFDPVAEEDERAKLAAGERDPIPGDQRGEWRRDKWILYPASLPSDYATADFPALPRPRRSNLTSAQPEPPIHLDLSHPMERPVLLAAGAVGGLGNPHFCTKSIVRPKFATKGESGMQLSLSFELKLLADIGLVGLPNAGKSTVLRALSRSRARVGDWPFTTLAPNIGTVVLDDHHGRPAIETTSAGQRHMRERFTVADIPGLIQDAHLDRGLGLGFLRHIERAGVLAFVVDLSGGDLAGSIGQRDDHQGDGVAKGDAVKTLKALWRELRAYGDLLGAEDTARQGEHTRRDQEASVSWSPASSSFSSSSSPASSSYTSDTGQATIIINDDESSRISRRSSSITKPPSPTAQPPQYSSTSPISAKPWFVIATKADLPSTQEAYATLQTYLSQVESGKVAHPYFRDNDDDENDTLPGKDDDALPENDKENDDDDDDTPAPTLNLTCKQPEEKDKDVWTGPLRAIPVSAINHHNVHTGDRATERGDGGVDRVVRWALELLTDRHGRKPTEVSSES